MKNISICVLCVVAIFVGSGFAEVKPTEFLLKYGYLKEKSGSNRAENPTPEEIHAAILNFQSFNGLPRTGVIDKETETKMLAPRCGVKDINGELAEFTARSKWPKNDLTWKINKYSRTSRLSPTQQKRALKRALKRWAEVTPLTFRETTGDATLNIEFGRYRHGDSYPFDGRGRVLAHAFFPQKGDTHFDDDEHWTSGVEYGTDLETVAAHEFGHALGLAHSQDKNSLMAPFYQKFPDGFKLHKDDIAGIQSLYGKKGSTPNNGRTTPRINTPPTGKGFCNQNYRKINAAMRISANDFLFVDNKYVIDGRNGRKMNIKSLFPSGPSTVHAAVYSTKTRTAFLFKDQKVWAYTLNSYGKFKLTKNYPKYEKNVYSQRPEAAMRFNIAGSERIYLIKNGNFIEFIPYYGNSLPGRGYSTRTFFRNIPSVIDATISSDEEVFFIVKNKFYKMRNYYRVVQRKATPQNSVFQACRR